MSEKRQDSPPEGGFSPPKNLGLKTQNSALPAWECRKCACATTVWNGPADLLLCANHPDHAGQLVLVAAGEGPADEAGSRCRSFRLRRKPVEIGTAGADDTVRYIPLTGGLFAIVDAVDYEWLSKYNWRAFGTSAGYYAYRTIKGRAVFMHRLIMDPPEGLVVDHINGNKHDNRRCNLRVCTQAENLRNNRKSRGSSRFKGVSRDSRDRMWVARIQHQGKTITLGRFDDEIKAARAYDRAARELFGPFAYLNFPQSGNIVLLSGRIRARSHARGRIQVVAAHHRLVGAGPCTHSAHAQGRLCPNHLGQPQGVAPTACRCHPSNQRQSVAVALWRGHPALAPHGTAKMAVRRKSETPSPRATQHMDERLGNSDQIKRFSHRWAFAPARGPPERRKNHALRSLD